jgi:hypothetical protein
MHDGFSFTSSLNNKSQQPTPSFFLLSRTNNKTPTSQECSPPIPLHARIKELRIYGWVMVQNHEVRNPIFKTHKNPLFI